MSSEPRQTTIYSCKKSQRVTVFCLVLLQLFATSQGGEIGSRLHENEREDVYSDRKSSLRNKVSENPQDVTPLLVGHEDCSQWLWGNCYPHFNNICGEGRKSAVRSGSGCTIIEVVARCTIACDTKDDDSKEMKNGNDRLWGVDVNTDKQPQAPTSYRPGSDMDNAFAADQASFQESLGDSKSKKKSPCRYKRGKVKWGPCINNVRERELELRLNKKNGTVHCPKKMVEQKVCDRRGPKSNDKSTNKKVSQITATIGPIKELNSEACVFETEETCGPCEKNTKMCTHALLSGDPGICGSRSYQRSCK